MAIISKLISLVWNVVNKIPNLRTNLNKFYAWKIFESAPRLKEVIYRLYDKYWYFELYIDNKKFSLKNYQNNYYKIEIDRIRHKVKNKNNFLRNEDWDLSQNLIDIEKTNEYNLVMNHFHKNIKWEDVKVFYKLTSKLSESGEINGISNEEMFHHLLEQLDDLYQNFNEGYQFDRKIKVGIGRNGNYILVEGLLYFSLLKALNQKMINVSIIKRHSEWQNFSGEFLKFQYVHGAIYQPLIHPDLSLESSYSDERFHVIEKNLGIKNGTLLDIGSNLGYFCHKFEDLGFDCYAVEIRPSNVYFMRKLRSIERKTFKIVNQSIFDLKKRQFDIVLALNIFHHFLREEKLYHQLIEFLNTLQVSYMYFQPHNPKEKVMQNAYKNFNNQQFVDFILTHSCLNASKLLSENVEGKGRPVYLLTK